MGNQEELPFRGSEEKRPSLIGCWTCPSKRSQPLRTRQVWGGTSVPEQPERVSEGRQRLRQRGNHFGKHVALWHSTRLSEILPVFLPAGKLKLTQRLQGMLGTLCWLKRFLSIRALATYDSPDRKVQALAKLWSPGNVLF